MKSKKKVLLIAVGLLVGAAVLFPISILLVNSFKTQKGIYLDVTGLPTAETFTFHNYSESIAKMNYVPAFINSLLLTVISTLFIVILSSMAAWAIQKHNGRLTKIVFFCFAGAMLVPFQCVMLPLVQIMSRMNMMNPLGLVFMYIGFGSSLSVVLFHGFIKGIPVELEEAALIDGCGMVKRYFMVVFPLLKTIIISVTILNAMWIWNDFLLPSLIINKTQWHTLPLRTYLFFGQFSKRWDLATAALIMAMIPIFIFYVTAQKHIVKGVTDGAIK